MFLFFILIVLFLVIEYNIHTLERFELVAGQLEADIKVKSKVLINKISGEKILENL